MPNHAKFKLEDDQNKLKWKTTNKTKWKTAKKDSNER